MYWGKIIFKKNLKTKNKQGCLSMEIEKLPSNTKPIESSHQERKTKPKPTQNKILIDEKILECWKKKWIWTEIS